MDQSNKKRKGLGGKGKLVMMSLYRATATTSKPPAVNTGGAKQRATVEFIVKQDQVMMTSQPKQSVAIVLPELTGGCAAADHYYYGGFPADEGVDVKATTYISTVRERMRLPVQTS